MTLLYKFYPQAPDASDSGFESAKLASDEAAIAHAAEVLARYPEANAIVVWEKGRLVHLLRAPGSTPEPAPLDERTVKRPAKKPARAARGRAPKPRAGKA